MRKNSGLPYPENWLEISQKIRVFCPQCTLCKHPARVVHHTTYKDELGRPLLQINEADLNNLIGSILFPLCITHHGNTKPDQVHFPSNWDSQKHEQRPKFRTLLRQEFNKKYPRR
jgi:hypothetical protein